MRRGPEGKRSRRHRDMSVATVVFTCPAALAATIDTATGPCVPSPGKRRRLVSVHWQHYGDRAEHMIALYQVLTGRPASGAWDEVKAADAAMLATFSNAFRSALASLGDRNQDVLVALDEVAARWLEAAPWPSDQRVEGLSRNRLPGMVGVANKAIEKQSPLYCWCGPAVPEYVIVSGQGLEEYETYRRNRRK